MEGAVRRTAALGRFLAERPVASARTGQTPHAVIHRQNKASLRYFPPMPDTAARAPVFVSKPLINPWTIRELLPDRSVLSALTAAGAPVYLLDWGRPTAEDAEVTLPDLVDGLLGRALDRALRHAATQHGAEALDVAGYCVGGTFLAMHLARHPGVARRAAFVATPIDFHEAGRIADMVKPETFPLDRLVDAFGNYPGFFIKGGFVNIRPTGELSKWRSLWERVEDPRFRALWAAMESWASDQVDFPGEAYRAYVRGCYFENRLMTGGWRLGGAPVDLGGAKIPALVLAADGDHIVPPASAFALADVWGGEVETSLVKGGHVGMCVGSSLPTALARWVAQG